LTSTSNFPDHSLVKVALKISNIGCKEKSKLTGVNALVQINEALLGGWQAAFDDGLLSLDLPL